MNEAQDARYVKVERAIVVEAQAAARELHAMYNALLPIERGLLVKQISVIARLVRAVEKL
ncbi:hypothetical protein [Burkholderia seminalis]|uniref:hypothetical protein n=1 Tax=Burkholderia seminalis TaxID=488731 RepID=UPI00264C4EEE|nr:hypothetical protein [Burkholderia seminalis]MDN7592078.1 hypothetical protein [Burkholderia seminalis]